MNVIFKVTKFSTAVTVTNGDRFTANLIGPGGHVDATHSEEITTASVITHAVWFKFGDGGLGCIFADERAVADVREGRVFQNATEVPEDQPIF